MPQNVILIKQAYKYFLFLSLLGLLILFQSCDDNNQEQDIDDRSIATDQLFLKNKTIKYLQLGCDTVVSNCVKYTIEYPEFYPHENEYKGKPSKPLKVDQSIASQINNDIYNLISNPSQLGDTDTVFSSPKQYFTDLTNTYIDDSKDFPSLPPYYDYFDINVVNNRYGLVSLELFYENYRGGAHGMYTYTSLNYDLYDAKKIEYDDIFIKDSLTVNILSRKIVSKLADSARKELGKSISVDQFDALKNNDYEILEEYGYFDPISISAHDNFIFDRKGITFVYNPYEIAPWVMGSVNVFFSYDEIKHLFIDSSPIHRMFIEDIQKVALDG